MKKYLSLLMLCFPLWAGAATYYVDCTNGNDANDGLSTEAPKLTIGAITQGAGDTINVKGGTTCSEMVTIGDNNITLKPYGTGRVTINAAGQNYGITATDKTGLTVSGGIDIITPTLSGVLVNCTVTNTSVNASISDVSVSGTVGNGASIGNGFRWFCADVALTDTSSDDTYSDGYYCDTCDRAILTRPTVTRFADGDTNGDGIQIGDSDNFKILDPVCTHPNTGTKLCIIHGTTTNTGGLIQGGEVSGGVEGAVSCSSNGCVVRQMHIHDVLAGDGSANGYGIKLLGNGTAFGNIVVNAKTCFFGNTASTAINWFDNVCWEFRNRGIDSNTTNAVTLKAQNNLIVAASSVTSAARPLTIGTGVTETITNNYYGYTGASLWADSGTTYASLALWQAHSEDTNSGQASNAGLSLAGGTSPTTPEGFRLSAASPLRAAGTYVGPFTDYSGSKFNNIKPSIGAYEVSSRGSSSLSSRTSGTINSRSN